MRRPSVRAFAPRLVRLVLVLSPAAALAGLAFACVDRNEIDGSTVAPVGSEASPPACDAVCGRLAALCGYAPVGCLETCEAEHDDPTRVCLGAAPSCQEALEGCFAEDEGEGEGEGEDASEDEADGAAGEGGAPDAAGEGGAPEDGGALPDAAQDAADAA